MWESNEQLQVVQLEHEAMQVKLAVSQRKAANLKHRLVNEHHERGEEDEGQIAGDSSDGAQ